MLLGNNPMAYSAVLKSQFITEQIKQDITARLNRDYKGSVEVNIRSLPYETVEVPDGKVRIATEIGNLNAVSIIKVILYVDEVKIKTFGARAEITVKSKVWVSRDWIKRGNTLKNLKMEKKEITSGLNKLPGENFAPEKYMARRNIRPGQIIELDDIEAVPTIVKNSPVSVIFKTPTVSVIIPCIALTSGKTGDFIKVKSEIYKKNYVGKIIGKNIVLVNI